MILIPVAFFWLTSPPNHRSSSVREIRMGISNARHVALALSAFEKKYGRFPNEETAAGFPEQTGLGLRLGDRSSNSIFRQLFAAGIVKDEKIFHAKMAGSHFPDDIISGDKLLEKGECAFGYFSGTTAADHPGRPILAAPMIPATDRFDPKPFQGKAIVATLDGSVRSYAINKNGHVMEGGKNLLDPMHAIWEGKPPVIKWQE